MDPRQRHPLRFEDENNVLRAILEGTATETGTRFFDSLVRSLSEALGSYSAWVTEYLPDSRRLRALAFWVGGKAADAFEIPVDGTPCQTVIEGTELVHHPENVIDLYPHSEALRTFRAVSYMGAPLLDANGQVLGNLAILDRRPIPNEPRAVAVMKIFANRASAELQRVRAERLLQKSEEKYRRIVETTGEGFLLLGNDLRIADVNEAFCRMAGRSRWELLGRSPIEFAADDFRDFLTANWNRPRSYRLEDVEGRLLSRQGAPVPVRIYGDILRDDRGVPIGYMYFLIDITHQKRSLALAAEVQKHLLPRESPRIAGFDVAGRTVSCQEIGGDYFDYIKAGSGPPDHLDVVVGDVTGHGVEAALLMTSARAHLRMAARRSPDGSLADTLRETNRHLVRDVQDTGRFMTLFYLRIDPTARTFRWVRAGHPPAVAFTPATGAFGELRGEGMALGMTASAAYAENTLPVPPGGMVIAVGTDGIWEAADPAGSFYGRRRFLEVVRQSAGGSAREILDAVFGDLRRFSLGTVPTDDITLVIVKADPDGPGVRDFQI